MARPFRESFSHLPKSATHFFARHMNRGLREMQKMLKSVDCIVEVHDARIPFSGRNPRILETVGLRPHVLVLNKMDLVNRQYHRASREALRSQGITHVIHTDCHSDFHYTVKRQLIPTVMKALKGVPRYHREESDDYNMMIVGIPNVGKSSLVNAIRRIHLNKGNANPVGAKPGITRSVMSKVKVCEHPLIHMLDTPGIMAPNIPDPDVGMKLALCGALPDHQVGEQNLADYLLYWLNKHERFMYQHRYGLLQPSDDILEVLATICKERNLLIKRRSLASGRNIMMPNFDAAAHIFIADFRDGYLGRIVLDVDMVQEYIDAQETQDEAIENT